MPSVNPGTSNPLGPAQPSTSLVNPVAPGVETEAQESLVVAGSQVIIYRGTVTCVLTSDTSGNLLVNGLVGQTSAVFGTANTWTAVQTFTNSDIRLLGSSTGYTTFTSANSSATNYTFTYPALTGTATVAGVSSAFFTPSNPTGTTSTAAFVMMGLGSTVTLTPSKYSVVRLTFSGQMVSSSASDGTSLKLAYGTGTAPVNRAAATGTVVGSTLTFAGAAAIAVGVPFSKDVIITGLTPGTAYWFDIQLKAVTAGTASVTNLDASVQEMQY